MSRAAYFAFLILSLSTFAVGKQPAPAPQILGIRLGMSYNQAHTRLNEIGKFKSEDEGQQVWTLAHDKHYQYLIIGFDRDRNVRYVTVLARPDGEPVNLHRRGKSGRRNPRRRRRESTLHLESK